MLAYCTGNVIAVIGGVRIPVFRMAVMPGDPTRNTVSGVAMGAVIGIVVVIVGRIVISVTISVPPACKSPKPYTERAKLYA
jgi:hypothetical protein